MRVSFRPAARDDLRGLFDYLSANAGPRVARGYVERIVAACLALERFPNRGVTREDLAPGFRALGFERRVTILYRMEDEVWIVRVLYGGRDLAALFANED